MSIMVYFSVKGSDYFMYNLIVVDDEQYLIDLMPKVIDWNSFGINIVSMFNSALSALDYMQNNHVDAVISDVRMPEMSGIEFIKRAKEIREDIVFIFISAYEDFSYAQQAIRLGVTDYITKPLKYDDLKKCCSLIKTNLDKQSGITATADSGITDSTAISRAKKYIYENCSTDLTLSHTMFVKGFCEIFFKNFSTPQ